MPSTAPIFTKRTNTEGRCMEICSEFHANRTQRVERRATFNLSPKSMRGFQYADFYKILDLLNGITWPFIYQTSSKSVMKNGNYGYKLIYVLK
jgi:hypothetical protein